MRIKRLTENKIQIILDIDELVKKNINIHTLAKTNFEKNTFFKSMLNEAEKQVGFKVKDCRLLIEAYSTSDGYVIFNLTKYKNEIDTSNIKKLKFKRKKLDNNYKNTIYLFNNFEEFCNFCLYCSKSNLLDLKGFSKNIALYEYKNAYYLLFSSINVDYPYLNLFYSSISEFANLTSTSLVFKSKLIEHGKPIFKSNAIKKGIQYFVGKEEKNGVISG